MDLRDSFSRLKKKAKHLGSKHKSDRTGVDADGESINAENPLPRPEPHTEADDGEGNGADTEGWRTRSADRPLQPDGPERVPVSGIENDKAQGEASLDRWKLDPRNPHPNPDIEVGTGSGPSREGNGTGGEEGEGFYSPSTPSIPRSGEPYGARTLLPQPLSLIVPLESIDPTIPYSAPETSYPDNSVKLGVVDSEPGSKSTLSVVANLLRGVRDSVNAFIPLKSIAGHLCFILEKSQVCPPSCTFCPQCLWSFQQTEAYGQAMELLAPQVKMLSESLHAPIHPGDVNEKQRGENLER